MYDPNPESLAVLRDFLESPSRRYLFGVTPYAAGIISTLDIRGVVDDVTDIQQFNGVPVIRTSDAPHDALVVATTLGRPRTAKTHLVNAGLAHCDYFTFHHFCGLKLPKARFWTGVREDAESHQMDLAWVRSRLTDDQSCEVFDRIVSFRQSANLSDIESFLENQDNQYFEEFLNLKTEDETFLDIGCFDGRTTTEFKKLCPLFKAVHIFEPDPNNFKLVKQLFSADSRINCHPFGLGDRMTTESFDCSGSTSSVSSTGSTRVEIRPLDSIFIEDVTFLKMDVEGSELAVIAGAKESLRAHHPRLAISVYHRPGDLWRIPKEILSIRTDYNVYLRHYTEGVTETVMFFLPIT